MNVKPLEWNKAGLAHTSLGVLYRVEQVEGTYVLSAIAGSATTKSAHRDEAEARAAAQVDLERRMSTHVAAPVLLPCPFCGETEHLYPGYRGLGGGKPYQIDCVGCGMDFTPREGIDAIAAWNRRAVPAPSVAEAAEPVATTTRFALEWIGAPRPPVHPNEMTGRQSFLTFGEAVGFMQRQPSDARFVSLKEDRTATYDRTSDVLSATTPASPAPSLAVPSGLAPGAAS